MTEQHQKNTPTIAILSLIFGCLFLIPFFGMLFSLTALILGIIALIKISGNEEVFKGKGLAISGIVLGGIGLVFIPIMAMLAAIAIPNLMRARLTANESAARANVMTISTALEAYASANEGNYPLAEYDLIYSQPPYLSKPYDKETIQGYNYSLDLSQEGYQIVAEPKTCGSTGKKIFISANGNLSEEDCR